MTAPADWRAQLEARIQTLQIQQQQAAAQANAAAGAITLCQQLIQTWSAAAPDVAHGADAPEP
jgi:hypothetical protein